jgi:natural product precursor
MKKLKLKNLSKVGDVLTSEELKHIYGGDGSGSASGCEPDPCSSVVVIDPPFAAEKYGACAGKSKGTTCDFTISVLGEPQTLYGICLEGCYKKKTELLCTTSS